MSFMKSCPAAVALPLGLSFGEVQVHVPAHVLRHRSVLPCVHKCSSICSFYRYGNASVDDQAGVWCVGGVRVGGDKMSVLQRCRGVATLQQFFHLRR